MSRILLHIFILSTLFLVTTRSNAQNKLDFKYKIYHKDSVNTDFYVKLDLSTYLAKIINNSKYIKVGVTVLLTNSATRKSYRSSREFNLDIKEYANSIYTDSFSILMEPADYEMDITITDLHLNKSNETYREFSKNYTCIKENFLILNSDNSLVYYKENPISEEVTFRSTMLQCDSIEIRNYNEIQTIALPPFSSKKIYPDAGSYQSKFYEKCASSDFKVTGIKNRTFFISSSNSNIGDGFIFSRFANFYPEVKTVDLLVEPLRYISSRDEYAALTDKNNQRRKKFEEFWIDKSDGDRESARELIKTYYSRVEFANRHFSTFKEGWKTDRGMMVIVFGEPESIENEGGKEERWIYSSRSGTSSISYSFYREDGPFLENDYSLVRNPMFKTQWYDAVDSWRSGMPYRK
jgi:GWxTD domain-containing protein